MKTRQSHQGRLTVLKHTKAKSKQADKEYIMTTEQTNITEATAQVVAEATRVAVQAMAVANADSSERTQNSGP